MIFLSKESYALLKYTCIKATKVDCLLSFLTSIIDGKDINWSIVLRPFQKPF